MKLSQVAVSPCSNPDWDLDRTLEAYAALGYRAYEAFTSWAKSALDPDSSPVDYRRKADAHGMRFLSLHLPPVSLNDADKSLARALAAADFTVKIGAGIVIFKAADQQSYVELAPRFLDAAPGVTTVIQNHFGTPLTSLADVLAVHERIRDARMKILLEVGHFHSAGVAWPNAVEALGEHVALVHIKDQVGRQSVPFGRGEIDLAGLVAEMDRRAYTGSYVVEMEVKDRANTLTYLAAAREYLATRCGAE